MWSEMEDGVKQAVKNIGGHREWSMKAKWWEREESSMYTANEEWLWKKEIINVHENERLWREAEWDNV